MENAAEEFNDLIAQRLVAKAHAEERVPVGKTLVAGHPAGNPQISKVDFVKVEKNLASLGFFTPSSKRVRNEKAKTISFVKFIDGKRIEAQATIAPSALYGLPITADQDKYLALQKVITDIQLREGRVANPVGFTSAELLKLLQSGDAGGRYKEITEWLKVMTLTGIISEGTVYFADRKQWVSDTFHVFDRVVSAGKEMPDGTVADRNYVWLSDWQLENINNNHLLPIDLETYRELKNHIAKALVPLLQIWLYASRGEGAYSKRYDELCQILNLRRYPQPSRIKEQFGASLNELQGHGYLASWSIEKTSDRKAFKIVFRHGEKFHRDRRRRLGVPDIPPDDKAAEPVQLAAADPRVTALVARGVTEKTAKRVLVGVADNQPVLDQLEWGDQVVGQDPQKIQNPAGFYVSLVRDNVTIPANFETSRRREERTQGEVERHAAREQLERLKRAYQVYQEQEIEKHLAGLTPVALQKLLAQARTDLLNEHKNLRLVMDEAQIERLARAKMTSTVGSHLRFMSFTAFCEQQKGSGGHANGVD